MKKVLLAGLFALVCSVAAVADDFVAMTLNFYAEGDITLNGKLPVGAVMMPKIRFNNKALPGHAYCVDINLAKVEELEASFTIKGEGKLVVSVNPRTMTNGKRAKVAPQVKCFKMIVNGKAARTPFVFNQWRYAANPIQVKDGDIVTIKAGFVKMED